MRRSGPQASLSVDSMTMTTTPSQIGPYRVSREIGRGGMGVVYLAHDERLGRDVAIKALPDHLAQDPDRRTRFDREARTLAQLHHPNVAAIFGVEEHDGRPYLVLEFVDGETLAHRLDHGPLPIDEALELCAQIARAVEAAHDEGVIHRDLKPGNVIVTPDGRAKVLDFGLARTGEQTSSTSIHTEATATTPTSPTIPGAILGTAPYMSPEQARGRSVDRRTDIWSFGVVLYECLTGVCPYAGESATDSIGAILHKEPDWSLLPANTPPTIALLLRRCLTRDKSKRLHDIADARIEIEHAIDDPSSGSALVTTVAAPRRRAPILPWVIALLAIAGLIGALTLPSGAPETPERPVRFTVHASDVPAAGGTRIMNDMAISPDGMTVAYIVEKADGTTGMMLRRFDSFEQREIQGVTEARGPTFSPDGRWLLLLDEFRRYVRVPVDGGPREVVYDPPTGDVLLPNGRIAWLDDGWVYLVDQRNDVLKRLHLRSRAIETVLDPSQHPEILGFENIAPAPGGLLATAWTGSTRSDYGVYFIDTATFEARELVRNAADAQLVGEHLIYQRDGSLYAAPYNAARAEIRGSARVVQSGVQTANWSGTAHYAASPTGTLVFLPGDRRGEGRSIVMVNDEGETEPAFDFDEPLQDQLALSPDGTRIACTTLDQRIELWVLDTVTGAKERFSHEMELYAPKFSPDGTSVWVALAGGGEARLSRLDLATGRFEDPELDVFGGASAALPDGRLLLQNRPSATFPSSDIRLWDPSKPGEPETLIGTVHNEWGASVSPDGAMMAYVSIKSGKNEIYLRRFPDGERDWLVGAEHCDFIRWSPGGDSIYYVSFDGVPAITRRSVSWPEGAPAPTLGEPDAVYSSRSLLNSAQFELTPEGRIMLIDVAEWEREAQPISVVLNWDTELRAD